MTPRRRAPRPLAAAVAGALEQVAPKTVLASVQAAWPDAVGAQIAAEATPVSERDGVVTVACRSATWADELSLMGPQLLEKLGPELPPGTALQGLRFSATGEHSET